MAKARQEIVMVTREQALDEARKAFQQGHWGDAQSILTDILARQPDDEAQELFEETELRIGIEKGKPIRGRLVIIPWRRVVTYCLIGVLLLLVVLAGRSIYRRQVLPQVQAAQVRQRQDSLFAQAESLYAGGQYEEASERLQQLLQESPDYEGAAALAVGIESDVALLAQYNGAVALEAAGALDEALAVYVQVTMARPGYRDVAARISAIKAAQQRDSLYAQAMQSEENGDLDGALGLYEQVQKLDASYQTEIVRGKLFALHVALGEEIIEQPLPADAELAVALGHFEDALALRPREATASALRSVVSDYLQGQERYQQGAWAEAVRLLSSVYERRPDFMRSSLLKMLYLAYINLGDVYRGQDDTGMAYTAYSEANNLPVADRALAEKRIAEVVPMLTPTATPTPTPTPLATPEPAALYALLTTPTPQPLSTYHNMIVFISDHEDSPGYWAMAPDGSQRQYLGKSSGLRKQYEELVAAQYYSPDGSYRLFVRDVGNAAQIFVQDPPTSQFPNPQPRQLTKAMGLCYDPAWSPDGAHIVFVSQASGSDDIHIINADGSGGHNLTENDWPWEKHPSWSPDSRRIVFWSNRDLRKQIYVMDDQGRNVVNISNTEYDEYDPVWVK